MLRTIATTVLLWLCSSACFAEDFYVISAHSFNSMNGATSYYAGVIGGSSTGCVFVSDYQVTKKIYSCSFSMPDGTITKAEVIGSSCSDGTVSNGTTCVVATTPPVTNKCTAAKGAVIPSFHWLSSSSDVPAIISINGCAAAISGISLCKTASPSMSSCSGTATITGDILNPTASGSASACTGSDCSVGDPQDGTTNDPCIKQNTGAGFTCTSKVEDSKVGQTRCGTANGVFVCTPVTAPSKTTVSNSVSQVQTANSDGSLSTKNVTTTTKTTCVAAKCTDTSYTTTTNAGTTSSGLPSGTSSGCVGSTCPSQTGSAGGGVATNPSTDGYAVSSKDCSKPIKCDGDIYQCAILNQDFINMCSLKELPTDKDFSDLKASSDKFGVAQVANQQDLNTQASSVLNAFKAASVGGGGSTSKCLPDYPFAVSGHSFDMKFSAACDSLSGIRYAILAIAYLLAIRRISLEL